MTDLNLSILMIISFFLGMLFNNLINKTLSEIKDIKAINDINNQFKELLNNLSSDKSSFVNRINNTVFINTKLEDYGDVTISYLLEKKTIAIFIEDKCIYTSDSADQLIIDSIIQTIDFKFKKEINDIVELLGFILSKEEFEKKYKIKIDNNITKNMGDIDNIIHINKKRLDMDEILDKIGRVGISNLTEEEKEFLSNFNRSNND